MYRPLFWISLGAATTVVLALATYRELTRYRPAAELHRAVAAFAQAQTVRMKIAASWMQGQDAGRVVSSLYADGQLEPGSVSPADRDLRFRLVRLAGAGQSYGDVAGEERVVGAKTYLTYVPPGPAVAHSPFASDGVWLSLSASDLARWGAIVPGADFPVASPFTAAPWSAIALRQLAAALPRLDIAYANGDGHLETVDGHPCHVIDIRFDRASTETALLDAARLKDGGDPTDAERLKAGLAADALSRLSIRAWIGTAGHRPYRLVIGGSVVSGQASTPLNALVEFSGYGAPVAFAAPASASTLADVLPALAAPPAAAAPMASAAPSVELPSFSILGTDDADQDGLNAILEAFYGTNPLNPDTDGDGVSDGAEVRMGCNPLGSGPLFGFGLGSSTLVCP